MLWKPLAAAAVALVALVLLGARLSADDQTVVRAELSATYQEADEGYFSFGQDTMVVTKPGSDLQQWLKGHLGQHLKLTIEPETKTNDATR